MLSPSARQALESVHSPCPHCRQPLLLVPELVGRNVRCLACGSVVAVRAAADAPGEQSGILVGRLLATAAACPHCHSRLLLIPELNGQRIRCKTCQGVFEVHVQPQAPTRPAPQDSGATEAFVWELPPERVAEPMAEAADVLSETVVDSPSAEATSIGHDIALGSEGEDVIPEGDEPLARPDLDADVFDDLQVPPTAPRGNRRRLQVPDVPPPAPAPVTARRPPPPTAAPPAAEPPAEPQVMVAPEARSGSERDAAVLSPPTPRPPRAQHTADLAKPEGPAVTEPGSPAPPEDIAEPAPEPAPPADRRPKWRTLPSSGRKTTGVFTKPAFRRHAQPSLVERPRYRVALLVGGGIFALAVFAGAWSLFNSSGHPQTRYLPRECDQFVSLNWKAVAEATLPAAAGVPPGPTGRAGTAAGPVRRRPEPPGLALVERCRTFLNSAGLSDRDVERVNVGRAADGSGTVVVYRLTRALPPEEIANRTAFRGRRKSEQPSQVIRGVPVYTLGPNVLAFPEPNVIVNGEADLVCDVLRRRARKLAEPLGEVLTRVDFSAASVVVSAGLPEPLLQQFLQSCSDQASAVRVTSTRFEYGPTLRCSRTLHLAGPQAMAAFAVTLQDSLMDAAKNAQLPESIRTQLRQARVASAETQLTFEFEVPQEQLIGKALEFVQRLFSG